MVPKQLIVAVEGTAAIGPFWQTIVSDYLDKIIRCFCGNEPVGQKLSTPQVELSLVMFNAHGSYSACLVQRSGWTKDMDIFFQWLSAIPFAGGGFNDAAIAEGLAEALTMFSSPNGSQNQNVDGQRHCILVAASNPYPLPTALFRLRPQNIESSDSIEIQSDNNHLSDAEGLAKSFAQSAISLSVICPKKLPKLRAIYEAGKRHPRGADLPVDNVKNPHFLVLISENFMEARAALGRSGMTNLPPNQNPVKMDMTPAPSIPGPPSANGSVLGRQPIPVGKNIPPTTVKVEPSTIAPPTGPGFPQISSVPRPASQTMLALQTSPPLSTSQEATSNNESSQDAKSLVRPPGNPAANVRILNDVAQARLAVGGTSIGIPSMNGTPMLSNVISSGMVSSVPPPTAQTVISSVSSGLTSVSGPLPIPTTGPTNSSIGVSQPSNNLQVGGNMGGQMGLNMSQGNLTVPQMVQTGQGVNNQNMTSASGVSGMPSGAGIMMPGQGMSQQIQQGMQPASVNSSSSVTNMPLNQQTSGAMPSAQSKYVRVWEGNLSGQRQGQPVFITRLEGYRSATASETLAANWPPTMQIVRLISQDHMNNKQYVGKADFLVFRAMDQHGFLGQLQEKKLCAVIQLPSQTLLLSVSDKAYRLIGMLFPGDMVVFKPQIPSQQMQAQQQQHLQHLQQQQQQQQMGQQQQPQQMGQQQHSLMQQPPQQIPQMQQQQQIPPQMNPQSYMQAAGRPQLLGQGGQVSSAGNFIN
ncbi:Mediator of RNA polymerase II transcription subunit 25 [Striga hermonthica]|uniref:Mediator of RNA polymerase II transcription subunit 25 n=1 Tax=Striga hermonthica TaxID=68872 RepID=A0A9N7MKB7_STRHE|nr:Mediator of RNA polymerase II transcription subunit 25 [Striga hermonthica]